MEPQTSTPLPTDARLVMMEQKIDFLVEEARKSQRARKITLWATILFFVLPLIGIIAILPSAMSSLTGGLSNPNIQSVIGN